MLAITGEQTLIDRLGSNADVEVVFVEGVQAALKTGIEGKRRLLAKAVANAVIDDALIEESWLTADVLSQLDVPHIRALDQLMREWERGVEPGDRIGWSGVWRKLPEPIRATLVGTGTAIPTPQSTVVSEPPQFIEGITMYGRELVRRLRGEGYGGEDRGRLRVRPGIRNCRWSWISDLRMYRLWRQYGRELMPGGPTCHPPTSGGDLAPPRALKAGV